MILIVVSPLGMTNKVSGNEDSFLKEWLIANALTENMSTGMS
jgi:hypothetical protein